MMNNRIATCRQRLRGGVALYALLSFAFAAGSALAQTALPPVQVNVAPPELCPLDGSTVGASAFIPRAAQTDDAAALLGDLPGVALQTNGGFSALPVLHGLADDRIRVMVDGMTITPSCPNHMNPALSYVSPTGVGEAQVLPGVTPVSIGGDSIGGTINVQPPPPQFSDDPNKILWNGGLSTIYRSNGDGISVSGRIAAASDTVSIEYAGSFAHSNDYTTGNGHKELATLYETVNHQLTAAVRGQDDGLLTIRLGWQDSPYEGFPNQPMDLKGNVGLSANVDYARPFDWGKLDVRAYWQNVDHYMNFLPDKGGDAGGGMPMKTHSVDIGYRVQGDILLSDTQTLRIGSDYDHYLLNDWWPAVAGSMMMGPNAFENINNGTRDRVGVFSEIESHWSSTWTTLFGVRVDQVWENTGAVQPYDWMNMMTADDAAAATAFNGMNRARSDTNLDLTALARYTASDTLDTEIGFARMVRSPNLYERYAWAADPMAQAMIGWFGDGNLYQGNPNLRPEVAYTASASAVTHDAANQDWELKITPYFTYVADFIGANQIGVMTMGGPTFAQLQFANHDAELYGIDASGHLALWDTPTLGHARAEGVLGWVQGRYVDTGKSLYHMMPLNAKLALVDQLGNFTAAADLRLVAPKTLVDSTRLEPTTPGFAVLNLRASYDWTSNIRLDASVLNVLNQPYDEPLGGVDQGIYSTGYMGPYLPVPAPGRSFVVGLTLKL